MVFRTRRLAYRSRSSLTRPASTTAAFAAACADPYVHRFTAARLLTSNSWFPTRSEAEMRRVTAETLYDLETECRRQGWGADLALVYDEERDLFRFHDGQFAFSREHADWALLRKRGRLKWMENAGGTG